MDDLNKTPHQSMAQLIKVGLTGGIGSGKSAVAQILENKALLLLIPMRLLMTLQLRVELLCQLLNLILVRIS